MSPARASSALIVAALVLAPHARGGPDRWVEARSPHFLVRSNADERTVTRVAREFELFRGALRRLWPWARIDPPEPVVVYAARDAGTLHELVPTLREPAGDLRPAGVFLTRGGRSYVALRTDLPVPRPEETSPYHVLYHEYGHLVLDLNVEDLPLWLHEGLAEYLGGTVIRDDGIELGRPLRHHLSLLRQEGLVPTDELLAMSRYSAEPEGGQASHFYAQSWALVHALMEDGRVGEYLRLRQEGLTDAQVAREVLGDTEELHGTLEEHLRGRLRSRQLPQDERDDPGATKSAVMGPSRVLAARGELLVAAGQTLAARALFERAVETDPGNKAASAALARLVEEAQQPPRAGSEDGYGLLERRCDAGILSDCVELGRRYRQGIGKAPDPTRALALFEAACAEGEPEACAREGWAFEHGEGTEADLEKAVEAYGWACDGGREWACERLGLLRESGVPSGGS